MAIFLHRARWGCFRFSHSATTCVRECVNWRSFYIFAFVTRKKRENSLLLPPTRTWTKQIFAPLRFSQRETVRLRRSLYTHVDCKNRLRMSENRRSIILVNHVRAILALQLCVERWILPSFTGDTDSLRKLLLTKLLRCFYKNWKTICVIVGFCFFSVVFIWSENKFLFLFLSQAHIYQISVCVCAENARALSFVTFTKSSSCSCTLTF